MHPRFPQNQTPHAHADASKTTDRCPLPTTDAPHNNTNHTVPGIAAYLKETLAPRSVVGLDPTVHPAKFVKALAKALAAKDIRLRPLGTWTWRGVRALARQW